MFRREFILKYYFGYTYPDNAHIGSGRRFTSFTNPNHITAVCWKATDFTQDGQIVIFDLVLMKRTLIAQQEKLL
jgi:hypothetical protein